MDPMDLMSPQRQGAIKDFHRARLRASLERLLARFAGRSADLPPYDEAAEKLQIVGRTDQGLRQFKTAPLLVDGERPLFICT